MDNLSKFDQDVLEKAYKRKIAESGDKCSAGQSSHTQWTLEDIDVAQSALELSDGKTLKFAKLIREKEQRKGAIPPLFQNKEYLIVIEKESAINC